MESNISLANQLGIVIKEISSATQEQTLGVEQINQIVTQIDDVTQSIASEAEEASATSEELDAQAHSLFTAVKQLYMIIEGKAMASDRTSPVSNKFDNRMVKPLSKPDPTFAPKTKKILDEDLDLVLDF